MHDPFVATNGTDTLLLSVGARRLLHRKKAIEAGYADVAAGGVSQEQLEKAVTEAIARGLVRKSKLIEAAKRIPSSRRLLIRLNGREASI